MRRHRIGTAALLLALFGVAACGGGGATNVAAKRDASTGATPAAPVVDSTTTAPEIPAAAEPAAAASAPDVTAATTPEPGTIEVDYQPADGATANATITGPSGSHSKSLESGAAIFGNLRPGTYSVTVTIDTPSDDPSIGDARQILNGDSIEVGAGDHATVTCDDSTGCSTT